MHSWTNTRTLSCNENQKMPMGKTRIPVKILDLGNRLIHGSRDFQVALVSRSSRTDKVISPFLYSVTYRNRAESSHPLPEGLWHLAAFQSLAWQRLKGMRLSRGKVSLELYCKLCHSQVMWPVSTWLLFSKLKILIWKLEDWKPPSAEVDIQWHHRRVQHWKRSGAVRSRGQLSWRIQPGKQSAPP